MVSEIPAETETDTDIDTESATHTVRSVSRQVQVAPCMGRFILLFGASRLGFQYETDFFETF